MVNVAYIIAALIVLGLLHFSGLPDAYNLAHPIWRINATVFGSLIGVFLTVLLLWLDSIRPILARKLVIATAMVFALGLVATLYYANAFISAADFNRFAIGMWHRGSYTVIATFVPLATFLVRMIVTSISGKR
jgi:hypothetical protein